MLEKMDQIYFHAQARGKSFFNRLREEERGASDMVAVIALIVIVLAVAVIFRERITGLATDVFDNVTKWVNEKK